MQNMVMQSQSQPQRNWLIRMLGDFNVGPTPALSCNLFQLSNAPSSSPSLSGEPSSQPNSQPSTQPTLSGMPSSQPSLYPSHQPSSSALPSREPSFYPSLQPNSRPSMKPSQVNLTFAHWLNQLHLDCHWASLVYTYQINQVHQEDLLVNLVSIHHHHPV